jgi:protein-S-isoprenylcysteine O-methyltransferase Ste14
MSNLSEKVRNNLKTANAMRFTERANKKRIVLHAVVAFALFAGCCFWIVMHYAEIHKPLSYVLLLGACGTSVGYLLVVWVLTKNRR